MIKPIVLCIGNVLLDISYNCENDDLLQKYGLKPDDSIELKEHQLQLFDEIFDFKSDEYSDLHTTSDFILANDLKLKKKGREIHFTPGGAAQNTARAMQWCLQDKLGDGAVVFTGCVGKDRMADLLETLVKESKVQVEYVRHLSERTGACAALITKRNQRSLCANIGASRLFPPSYILDGPLRKIIETVDYIYCEGFFLTHSSNCIMTLVKLFPGKRFFLNLSGTYICEEHFQALNPILPFADIIFGNFDEAVALSKALGLHNASKSFTDIILDLRRSLTNSHERKQTLIITRGPKSVLVCEENEKILSYDVPPVDDILDTIGAGDAFVSGFLASYFLGKTLDTNVSNGIRVAQEIIKMNGCAIPNHSFNLDNVDVILPNHI